MNKIWAKWATCEDHETAVLFWRWHCFYLLVAIIYSNWLTSLYGPSSRLSYLNSSYSNDLALRLLDCNVTVRCCVQLVFYNFLGQGNKEQLWILSAWRNEQVCRAGRSYFIIVPSHSDKSVWSGWRSEVLTLSKWNTE